MANIQATPEATHAVATTARTVAARGNIIIQNSNRELNVVVKHRFIYCDTKL